MTIRLLVAAAFAALVAASASAAPSAMRTCGTVTDRGSDLERRFRRSPVQDRQAARAKARGEAAFALHEALARFLGLRCMEIAGKGKREIACVSRDGRRSVYGVTKEEALTKHRIVVALAVVACALGASAVVKASIPDGGGVIHGCYAKSAAPGSQPGSLRVIDTALGRDLHRRRGSGQLEPDRPARTARPSGCAGATGRSRPDRPEGRPRCECLLRRDGPQPVGRQHVQHLGRLPTPAGVHGRTVALPARCSAQPPLELLHGRQRQRELLERQVPKTASTRAATSDCATPPGGSSLPDVWVNDIGTVNTPQGQTTTIGGLSLPAGAFLLDITGEAADDVGGSDEYGMRCDTSTGQHMTDFGAAGRQQRGRRGDRHPRRDHAGGADDGHLDVLRLRRERPRHGRGHDRAGGRNRPLPYARGATGRGAPRTTQEEPCSRSDDRAASCSSRLQHFAAALGITAAVQASIPDAGGVIHGCYKTNQGTLRVIDPAQGQTCSNGESPLDWSQTGPAGAQGPQGQQGQQGPKGNPGPTYGAGTGIGLTGNAFDILGSYQLPQGCSPGQSPFLLGFPLTHPWGCFNAVGGGQNCFHDNYVTGFGQDGSLNCAAIPDDDPVGPDAYVTRHQESQDTPQNIDTTVGTLSLPAGSFLGRCTWPGREQFRPTKDTRSSCSCWFGPRAFSWGKPYTTVHGDGGPLRVQPLRRGDPLKPRRRDPRLRRLATPLARRGRPDDSRPVGIGHDPVTREKK